MLASVAVYTVPVTLLLVVLLAVAGILLAGIPPHGLVLRGVPADGRPPLGASDGDRAAQQLVWFLHVSDVHLDQAVPARTAQLVTFCNETVRVVDPALVLATGDLTDGPDATARQTGQVASEWGDYRATLERFGLFNASRWLDLRGNHDVYGVPSLDSPLNLYRDNGVHGADHHYVTEYVTPRGGYRFVSLDLAIDPGAVKPWAFFGANPSDLRAVVDAVQDPTLSSGARANHTFLLGHFPMATTASLVPWDEMAPYVTAYFCGHLHSAGMYRRMWAGYLELEVEDMKNNQAYRLVVLDHDLMSFTDVHLGEWPIAVVSNPKDAMFLTEKEPLELIATSTHIRVVAFSPSGISSVAVTIEGLEYLLQPAAEGALDGGGGALALTLPSPDSPLHVVAWDPAMYGSGIHQLRLRVVDGFGRVLERQQPFSVDGTSEAIPYTWVTLINGFPTSVFIDVLLTLTMAYFVGLLLWLPRLYSLAHHLQLAERLAALWTARDLSPVLVNEYEAIEALQSDNTFEVFPVYKDLDNTSVRGRFMTAWSSHMATASNMAWLKGWAVILLWSLLLVSGPVLVLEKLDGEHWGIAFSWGVWTPDGFTLAVESEIMGMAVLLLVFSPAALLFVELAKRDPELSPLRCYTVFLFLLSLVSQVVLLLEVLLFFPVTSWLASPFGLPFTLAFAVQTAVSLRSAWRRWRTSAYNPIQ